MSNLIKNKLLITMLFVVSLFVMYDVGLSAVTPVTLTSTSRTANIETQDGGITKVNYTTAIRWDIDTVAAAAGWYGDTNTTVPLVIPSTSMSGVKAFHAAVWITTTDITGDFSDSIGSTTDDTCEVVWEYSMDNSRWYTATLSKPQESRMLTQTASTATGSNFIAFGPIDRFAPLSVDSTADLRDVDGNSIWATAQYIRARVYIHGEYMPNVPPAGRYALVNFKSFITLKRD